MAKTKLCQNYFKVPDGLDPQNHIYTIHNIEFCGFQHPWIKDSDSSIARFRSCRSLVHQLLRNGWHLWRVVPSPKCLGWLSECHVIRGQRWFLIPYVFWFETWIVFGELKHKGTNFVLLTFRVQGDPSSPWVIFIIDIETEVYWSQY